MRKQIKFRYFPEYKKWAKFSNEKCLCLDNLPCLDAIYFENPDIEDPVCLDLLVNGQVQVEIPDYLQKQLLNSLQKTHPDWNEGHINNLAAQIVDTLSKTPPIPWIQHNAWPVCCGDFCCYLGEWDHERISEASPDGDGSAFLWAMLEEPYRKRRENPNNLWQEIKSRWTVIYVFRCFECDKLIAVDQSY